ncbi:hypothetical protein [Streptomyces malaysiensis]|uniref:hypothetical protein n=1 Tax=Streptomyces malaysiensis TaxID=92644 RepID=UPI0036CA5860
MNVPTSDTWVKRELVTADAMNRRVRDAHLWLYNRPYARVTGRQYGSASTTSGSYPSDTISPGPFTGNAWKTHPFYVPGTGVRKTNEFDSTGGLMTPTGANGAVWKLVAPVDGLYEIIYSGVLETSSKPVNVHLRLGVNVTADTQYGSSGYTVGSEVGGHVSDTRHVGDICVVLPLQAGDAVSAGAVSDKTFWLGNIDLPDRTSLSMQWVGRYA